MTDRLVDGLKYRAFISYSRADRAWAKLLHARLEHYVLPQALRAIKPGLKHDTRPLKPIFRDEDELVPGQDLPARIRAGLDQSEFLIVICSPNAVASEWVDKEILDFAALGGRSNILAVIVDGEPNAAAHGSPAALECLPAALRFDLDLSATPEGVQTATISDRPAEPLWIDWRSQSRGDRTSFLRLIAALLSLSSLDRLIDRDRAYRRGQAILAGISAGVVALAFLGFGATLALQTRQEEIKNSNTLASLARQAGQDGDWERSARYALLGMKGADTPVFGFDARTAKDALLGALLNNRRIGLPHDHVAPPDALTALSSDGSFLAIANSGNGPVRIVDTRTGKDRRAPLAIGPVESIALSPDGQFLVGQTVQNKEGGPQSVFQIWNIKTGQQASKPLFGDAPIAAAIQLSADNTKLLVNCAFYDGGGFVQLFDVKTGVSKTLAGAAEGIDSATFSPDGKLVGAAWLEGVELFDSATGSPTTDVMKLGGAASGKVLAIAPDNKTLAVGTSLGSLLFWDVQTQTETANSNLGGEIVALAFSGDAHRFGAQFSNGMVRVWEGDGPDTYASAGTKFMPGGGFIFLPDNRRLLTIAPGVLRYWNLASYDRTADLRGAHLDPDKAAFSPDGRVVAILAYGGKLVMRDTETFAQIGPVVTFEGDTRGVLGDERVAFSPDGAFVAHQNPQGTWLVDWRTGAQWRLPSKPGLQGAIAFSPDGASLAVADDGLDASAVTLWNVRSHQQIGATINSASSVTQLSFSSDGKVLAIGPEDKPHHACLMRRCD
ncbi:MAG: toll/interleukin-1 receptor domain-containing protein [Alphaproteobacteria bacterium]